MQWATQANEAYQTLKHPVNRGVLPAASCRGSTRLDASNTNMAPAFLMQQMEWREALEEARAGKSMAALDALTRRPAHRASAHRDATRRSDRYGARLCGGFRSRAPAAIHGQTHRRSRRRLRRTGKLKEYGLTADCRTRHVDRAAPASAGGRHRSGHDQFAGGHGALGPGRGAGRRSGAFAAAVGGALPRQLRRRGGLCRPGCTEQRSPQHHRVGQALHGARR